MYNKNSSSHLSKMSIRLCGLSVALVIGATHGALAQDAGNIRRFAGQSISFAGYSSAFNDKWAASFGKYFTERTGITINWIPSSPSKNITSIRASGGNPDIDVMLMDSANLARGIQEGVVGTVDPAKIPNMKKVPESLQIKAGIPSMAYRYGNCYRTDKFEQLKLGAPNDIAVWSAPGLAGRVMFPSTTAAQWLINAPAIALSAGGSYSDVSGSIKNLSSKVKAYGFFNSSGDMDAAMSAGDVWLTVGNNQGRCLALKKQGVPVAYATWNIDANGKTYSDLINPDNLVLVANSPKKELVELMMNEFLSDEAAKASVPLFIFIAGTPPTAAAIDAVMAADASAAEWIIKEPSKLFLPDYPAFLANLREWTTQWAGILR
ncbi:extracellular solute-binding protein [Chelatococcus asaccharovorans]|uniref:extracellular solute-binding protein n=1 Tax=Chelatococcus asaccharovorans TaxID=28210 RepID=UPI00224C71FA|nr:extracellular solute-binding protein [Chelatococcus asaccharovorans]CAH1655695.1 Spermidine/putrescine-binding protein [Chelatococcus asaccharovorans]CAH1685339.1 Spermidine/putrescine-binding protein [Chelatococcus asaccharovorans]